MPTVVLYTVAGAGMIGLLLIIMAVAAGIGGLE